MAETYVLNVDFNGECNVFHVSYNTTWETVDMLLKVNCGEDIKVTYTDEENDQVCINSQAELEEALKCARNGNDVLSVQVVEAPRTPPENSICRDDGSSTHDEVASAPEEPPPVPELVLVTDEPTKLSEFPKPIEEQPQADRTRNKGKSGSRTPYQLLSGTSQPVQMDTVTPDITVTDHTYSKTPEELEKLPDVALLGQDVVPSTSSLPRPSKSDIPRSRVCKRKAKSYYASLAESMGATRAAKMAALIGPQVGDGSDQADGRMHVARCLMRSQSLPDSEKPPKWFVDFMKEFKEETGKEITMEVLRSIKETSSSPGSIEGPSSPPPVPGTAVPVPANVQTNGSAAYVHTGIICDQCEQIIVGIRYKCANCSDYDLCEACEQVHAHNPAHVFLKMRTPAFGAGRKNGKMVPLLKNSLYGDETEKTAQSDTQVASTNPSCETREAAVTSPAKPVHEARVREECKKIKEMKVKELKEERRKLKEERQRLKEERKKLKEEQKRRLEAGLPLMAYRKWGRTSSGSSEGTSDPVYRPLPPPPPVQAPKITSHMDAVFVCDGNMGDGTHVQPGTKFTKHWVMRNEGAGNWTSNTKLTLMWGTITVVSPSEVSVPFLQPQEEGTISVEFQAPEHPGEYQSHWRLMHHGLTFGHRVWCSIVVDQPEILEPVLEAANMVQNMKIASPPPANQETEQGESTAEVGESDSQKSEDGEKSEDQDHADFADATQAAIAAVARLKTPPSDCSTLISAVDILTAQDLLSFEMLDVGEGREVDNVPNNTPIDMTPRISPLPCIDEDLLFKQNSSSQSQTSIVEVINEVVVDGKENVGAAASEVEQMEEGVLVENRMAVMEVKKEPIDEDTSSQSSDSTVDSDDYIVVPMPDCFNPEIPLDSSSLSSNTDVAIQTDGPPETANSVDSRCSTPEIVQENGTIRIQDKNEFQPILIPLPAPVNQVPTANQIQVIDLTGDDDDDDDEVVQVKSEPLSNDAAAFLTEIPEPAGSALPVEPAANQNTPAEVTANEMPALEEDSGLVAEGGANESAEDEDDLPIGAAASDDQSNDTSESTVENTVVKHPPVDVATDATEQNSTNADNELNNNTNARRASDRAGAHATFHADGPIVDVFPTPRGLSAAEFGGAVVNGAINVASNIVTALFGSNGRQNQPYIPPQQTLPPERDYTPPAPTWPPPPTSVSPMDQLFEMGFGNRELNQRLLDKHGNDLNRVVPELLAMMDNNWHEQRH